MTELYQVVTNTDWGYPRDARGRRLLAGPHTKGRQKYRVLTVWVTNSGDLDPLTLDREPRPLRDSMASFSLQ